MPPNGIQHRLLARHHALVENNIRTEALLFPEIDRLYREYDGWLRLDPAEVRARAGARLADQLRHAAAQVPAYRGNDPRAPLRDWPFVTKADLRDRLADHCDDEIRAERCRAGFTTGTTGIPVKLVHDVDQLAHKYALALRRNRVAGLPARRRILIPMRDGALSWTEHPSPAQGHSSIAHFGAAADDAGRADALHRSVLFAPDVVYGHPSSCLAFLAALRAAGLALRPRRVLSMGEQLTEGARAELAEGFAAPVRDGYGMAEFGTIAVQCDRGAYHVESERLLVEIVDADGTVLPPGERGEIVVTDLLNRAMPLIRYRTGDHGGLADRWCDCGYPGDLLTGFTGRDHGTLTFSSGTRVPVIALTRVVRLHPLRRFQIVRRRTDELEVLVSPRTGVSAVDVTAGVVADLAAFLAGAATATARVVGPDGFLADDAAKSTDFVSLVEQEGGGTS